MPKIRYLQSDEPNNPNLKITREGYGMKRGKQMQRTPRASWGMTDGNKKPLDPNAGRAVLDEAER